MMNIGIVAPAGPAKHEILDRVETLCESRFSGRVRLKIHPQCFLHNGHFAGDDATRAQAFVDYANDPELDAIWFARGGYGSNRIFASVMPRLNDAARRKTYLGYSDMGFLLAGLAKAGFKAVHGPMPVDIDRENGEQAALRALSFLTEGNRGGLEPGLQPGQKVAAFNMMVLSALLGSDMEPDFTGVVLMLEEVSEYMYRIDRTMFHITSAANVRRVAGIRLGRVSAVPDNDPPFGQCAEEVVRHWCDVSGIPYLGRADIGHDSANKIVPFTLK